MGFTLHRGFESRPLRYEVCYGWLEPNTDDLVCGGARAGRLALLGRTLKRGIPAGRHRLIVKFSARVRRRLAALRAGSRCGAERQPGGASGGADSHVEDADRTPRLVAHTRPGDRRS